MASTINIEVYSDALVVLGTAGIVVPLVHRWGLSPVLGYLGAGALLGPLGLGSFIATFPFLYWLTIVDARNVSGIADLGVVFLLFVIGLELSYERLMSMRRLVFALGGLQVLLSAAAIASIVALAGLDAKASILIGACLALSSTAIVLEVLSSRGRLASSTGRASFAVLLAQDLAVVPILILVAILGADKSGSVLGTVTSAMIHAAAAVIVIVVVGRALLRPLFRLVAGTGSTELFIAACLFVIVATGVIASLASLSMALGGFLAGLLLAETEYRKSIEATIAPFKGILLGIFFFTIGMSIDARELAREPIWLLSSVAGLVCLKATLMYGLARLFGLSPATSLETGLLLGPGGEFAFVVIGLSLGAGLVTPQVAGFTLAVASLSMAMIPLIATAAGRVAKALDGPKPRDPALAVPPEPQARHAIVVGHGRVGKVVCEMLRAHGIEYTAIDDDPSTVRSDRSKGHAVYFGDGSQPDFLKACGLAEAAGVVLTINSRTSIDKIVRQVRELRPDVPIFARARDAHHARHLYAIGASDVVPETIEASLQLSEAALVGLGIPSGPVIASIHDRRDAFRQELQEAAKTAGIVETRSLRARSRSGT